MRKFSLLVPFAFFGSLGFAFNGPALALSFQPTWCLDALQDEESDGDEEEGEDGEEEDEDKLSFGALKFRSIGPSIASGRIGDLAVDPNNPARFYAAACSGGVWKTENAGTTWKPIFDGQDSYSIGCIAMDPRNSNVLWVGSGENNSQRSVSFGNGVYRSMDGGANWKHLGLETSEHIGDIHIDARDSDVVFVAAQGPLWKAGGERGLYKTDDGGDTWRCVLEISEDTGVNEVHADPNNPDVLYASSYQRRRAVWTLLNGGPESAIHKSVDGGETWRKIKKGLPSVDKGRIGLLVSPVDSSVLYAIVEAAQGKSGLFRSTDYGETWSKRSSTTSSSPQYYNELVADPTNVDKLYLLDTYLRVSEDGGKTFSRVPNKNQHVDHHALWIDPDHTDHMIGGCDGGVYETHDGGQNWRFCSNLPITQFYRVALDNDLPFYNVYGGTQDNNTLGGPVRTTDAIGIANEHWLVTVGGDGFEPAVDPTDPNIVYSQWQYGNLIRFDKQSGERTDIKPRENIGEAALRWNWDAPLLISPHDHKRLYYAANILFRSDDRGDSWTAVSGDLSRQLDRNQLEVMGRVWEVDSVAKNASTSPYGNIVALSESPLVEGLLYVGTDDGLVQVSEDGGASWRLADRAAGLESVPELAYVSEIEASQTDAGVVYVAFDAHKEGDFNPYLFKSSDRGLTWTSISSNLESPEIVYSIAEDHVEGRLLFLGTEFGCYVSIDGGAEWHEFTKGLPTIAVRDVEIQRREDDLVLATFGRSFYVLDDYSALRSYAEAVPADDAVIYPVRDTWSYIQRSRLGSRDGRGSQGGGFYSASNPEFGATFTYFMPEKVETLQEQRRKAEKEARKAEESSPYPSWDDLAREDKQSKPKVMLVVADSNGQTVRRLAAKRGKGLHRTSWNLRLPSASPIRSVDADSDEWSRSDSGPLVLAGTYQVSLVQLVDGASQLLAGPQDFQVKPLNNATLPAPDRAGAFAFQGKVTRLQRAIHGAGVLMGDLDERLSRVGLAILETPGTSPEMLQRHEALRQEFLALNSWLSGSSTLSSRNAPTPTSIRQRLDRVVYNQLYTSSAPTQTERDGYRNAGEQFKAFSGQLSSLVEVDLPALERELDELLAPHTPGRMPRWSEE